MLTTFWATVRNGKIELLDLTELPEGTKAIVTLLPERTFEKGRVQGENKLFRHLHLTRE